MNNNDAPEESEHEQNEEPFPETPVPIAYMMLQDECGNFAWIGNDKKRYSPKFDDATKCLEYPSMNPMEEHKPLITL